MRHPLATLTLALAVGPLAARAGVPTSERLRTGRNVALAAGGGPALPAIGNLLAPPTAAKPRGSPSLGLAEAWAWNGDPAFEGRIGWPGAESFSVVPEEWRDTRAVAVPPGDTDGQGGLAGVLRSGTLTCPIDAQATLFLRATPEALDGDAFAESWPNEAWCAEDAQGPGLCFALGIAFGL